MPLINMVAHGLFRLADMTCHRRKMGVIALAMLYALVLAGCKPAPQAPTAAAASAASAPAAVPPSPDGIPLADAHAGAVRVPSDAQAWGGARQGSEQTLSDQVVAYRIHARLDPKAHTVEGRQQLSWRNRSAREVRAVYLHLYLNAFEGEGSTFMTERRQLGFEFRSDVPIKDGDWGWMQLKKVQQQGADVSWHFVHPDGGPATDRTVVRLDLPQPVAPGASTTLDIDFLDQLPRVLARTGHFETFHLVAQWFPKIGVLELPGERGATEPRWNVHEMHLHSEFYADYGRYDVTIDVPQGWVVGATGEQPEPPVTKDGRTVHRFVQDDVHDFAWTADSRTAPPLEGSWSFPGSPPVKLKVLFPPEYAAIAPRVLKATQDSLTWFSSTLGPYPYRTVTAVIPPFNAAEAGGMEYPTFFTADAVQDASDGTLGAFAIDFVTIHEFGHGYFYGILGSNEFEEPMLDEGLNEYWDHRMLRARGQVLALATPLMKRLGLGLSLPVFDLERFPAGLADPVDGLGRNSWDRLDTASYATVYMRTATAMRDLEERLGRATMEKAFAAYYARWKFRHPSIADFRDVLAEVSGQPAVVDEAFARHVYAASRIDDRIESFTSDELLPERSSLGAGRREEFTEKERDRLVDRRREDWEREHPGAKAEVAGPFPWRSTLTLRRHGAPVPQQVLVKFADGSSETVRWDDGERWKRFVWVKPAKAVSAELDPERLHYLDAHRADNSRSIEPERAASRRLASDGAGLLQALMALVASL